VGGVAEGFCTAVELSDAERDQLLELCRQRLDAFRARGRCECCGAHEHQRALEVDHIVPSNHGGSDDLSNLQALCFRGVQSSNGHREAGCVFCVLEGSGRVLLENGLALHPPEWNAVVELVHSMQR
jgi:ATP adenylyltransferase